MELFDGYECWIQPEFARVCDEVSRCIRESEKEVVKIPFSGVSLLFAVEAHEQASLIHLAEEEISKQKNVSLKSISSSTMNHLDSINIICSSFSIVFSPSSSLISSETSSELSCISLASRVFSLSDMILKFAISGQTEEACISFIELSNLCSADDLSVSSLSHVRPVTQKYLILTARELLSTLEETQIGTFFNICWPRYDGQIFAQQTFKSYLETVALIQKYVENSVPIPIRSRRSWLIESLLSPISERFVFFFHDCPYSNFTFFSWLLRIANSAIDFIHRDVQPILSLSGLNQNSAANLFLGGLISLGRNKLVTLLADYPRDLIEDKIFSQVISEAQNFDVCCRQLLLNNSSSISTRSKSIPNNCIDLFLDDDFYFEKLIRMDTRAIEYKLCIILNLPWEDLSYCPSLSFGSQGRLLKPCRMFLSFMDLFMSIKDRYQPFSSRPHRLFYLANVHIPLVETMVRYLQEYRQPFEGGITQSNWSIFCSILEFFQCLSVTLSFLSGDFFFADLCTDMHPHTNSHSDYYRACSWLSSIHLVEKCFKEMINDASTTIRKFLFHYLQGYSDSLVLFDFDESSDVSPFIVSILSWLGHLFSGSRFNVGQTTYDSIGRAVSRTIVECIDFLLPTLSIESRKKGLQFNRDIQALVNFIQGAGFSVDLTPLFLTLEETSALLSLSDEQICSILSVTFDPLKYSDDSIDTQIDEILTSLGITSITSTCARRILRKRKL